MHIIDVVYYWGRATPLRPAVIQPEGIVTYAALVHAIETAAQHFARSLVDKSKPVAVSLPGGMPMLVGALGLIRAGFSVVLAGKPLYEHLPAVNCNALVLTRDRTRLPGGTNVVFDEGWITYGASVANQDKPVPAVQAKGGDVIFFTSGSTGRPKPVTCPPESWEQRVAWPYNSVFANYDRFLVLPSLNTAYGFSRAYETLYTGRTVCMANTEEPLLWLMQTYDIDGVLGSPQQILYLAEMQEKTTRYPLSSLKTVHVGASAISPDGVRRIQKNLCRNIISMYGSTEVGHIALAPYDMIAGIPGAVGFIVPGSEAEVVDGNGQVLPLGTEGFLRISSTVLHANIVGGERGPRWFYPGDLGRIVENRVLCIAGRVSDVVNRGGEKLSITDFERFLLGCPGVKDAGVCTPIGTSGREEAWIALVLDPSTDLRVLRHAIQADAHFGGNIDKLFIVDKIPRGDLGKIQRESLKTMLQEIAAQSDNAGDPQLSPAAPASE